MKHKLLRMIVICLSAVALLTVGIWSVATLWKSADHALQVSSLLRPLLEADNQSVHIAVSARVDTEPVNTECDFLLLQEDDRQYLALERNGTTVYFSGNILFLENGKAFRLGQELQTVTVSCRELLPQIVELYEALTVAVLKTEDGTDYTVTVDGDYLQSLLSLLSFGDIISPESIESVELCLSERDGALEQICFAGGGTVKDTEVALRVILSDFQVLDAGERPVPEAVKQSAAEVDPDTLFSLTEDLYRLVPALAPLADMDSLNGTLRLFADCLMLQVDTEMTLSDLKIPSAGELDLQKFRALPEELGWLFMESEISCTREGDGYAYVLVLDQDSMQELARMALPSIGEYARYLSEGRVSLYLQAGGVSSIQVEITGKFSLSVVKIPITVGIEFLFA